jgi:hypothetical protein
VLLDIFPAQERLIFAAFSFSVNKNNKFIRKSGSFLGKFDLGPHQPLLFCHFIFYGNAPMTVN